MESKQLQKKRHCDFGTSQPAKMLKQSSAHSEDCQAGTSNTEESDQARATPVEIEDRMTSEAYVVEELNPRMGSARDRTELKSQASVDKTLLRASNETRDSPEPPICPQSAAHLNVRRPGSVPDGDSSVYDDSIPTTLPDATPQSTSAASISHAPRVSFEEISPDLINGRTPAIEPIHGGIHYRTILKLTEEQSKNLPDVIRVLTVHPGSGNDPLVCSFKVRLLPHRDSNGDIKQPYIEGVAEHELPLDSYMALSYTWQGQTATEEIQIRHPKGLLRCPVTPNLKDALLAFRHSRVDRRLWADALCINQSDPNEIAQQLLLWPRVYGEAEKVLVWLGKGNRKTNDAFSLMKKIRQWKNFNTVVEQMTTAEEWLAFIELISNEWFSRRWVLQEILLAQEAELHCGTDYMDWEHFMQALGFADALESRVLNKFRMDLYIHPDVLGEFQMYSAFRLASVIDSVVSRNDQGRVERKKENLETLISTLTPFVTGNPKGIVYAVLSMAKDIDITSMPAMVGSEVDEETSEADFRDVDIADQSEKDRLSNRITRVRNARIDDFPVDNNKRFDEVCEDLYKFMYMQSRSLDLICRPWCPASTNEMDDTTSANRTSIGLPTWVRTLEDSPFEKVHDGRVRRVNADSLVGLPGRSPYDASRGVVGNSSFERDGDSCDHSDPLLLVADGFQLDTVTRLEASARGGIIPKQWLKARYKGEADSRIKEEFWQTMVAGKGPNGNNAPRSYALFAQDIFNSAYDINLNEIKQRTTIKIVVDYLNRVLAVVTRRKLARTEWLGRLVLLPAETQPGDIICILANCSVPVVLRKSSRKTKGSSTRPRPGGQDMWELVGECYMHGMMSGDALRVRWEKFDRTKDRFYKNRKEFIIC